MGMNFYLHRNACEHCGRGDEPIHIGKSSAGWCFSLHVMPEEGIATLTDWMAKWVEPGAVIKDECGVTLTANEMLERITNRSWVGFDKGDAAKEAEFHRMNKSERGPNGLLRHRLSRRCIGHGDGTWDYIVGDFS